MHYLIDGYNLLFRTQKGRGSLEKRRQLMIQELNACACLWNLYITLVFDGAEAGNTHFTRSHYDALELIYTPKNQTADQYMIHAVSESAGPEKITIVTNDRDLAQHCRLFGAKKMGIDEFLSLLVKKKMKKKTKASAPRNFYTSTSEFERLLRIFEKKLQEELENED